jgi:hypothetical protein
MFQLAHPVRIDALVDCAALRPNAAFFGVKSFKEVRMRKAVLIALAIAVAPLWSADNALAVPTKDIVQPGQGLAAAQEACPRYAGDEAREIACVLFHAGAVKKTNGQYQLNVQLLQPAGTNTGNIVRCRAEMIHLPDGGIGWKETGDCH